MKRRWSGWVALVAVVTLILTGCSSGNHGGGQEAASNRGGKQFISIGGSPIELPYYQTAAGFSKIINENFESIQSTTETTAGAKENAVRVTNGELELALTDSHYARDSYLGVGDFEGKADRIRTVMAFYKTYAQIAVLSGSDIQSLADLKGKRVGVGPKGSASHFTIMELFELSNMTVEDVEPFYISTGEAVDMMKNNQLDAAIQTGPLGVAPFLELSNARDVHFLEIDEQTVDAFLNKYPYDWKAVIPAGTYEGQDQDIQTLGFSHALVCSADLSDEMVYEMTKAFYENLDELKKIQKSFEGVDEKTFNLQEVAIPLHPGALRYYEERNVPNLEEYKETMAKLKS